MSKLGPSFKVCQTCRYWNGSRDINGMTKLVEAYSSTGKCCNTKVFYNQNMSNMASCNKHEPVI